MTTTASINTDSRMVAAGLAANGATSRPAIITATGRAAPSQFAAPPAGSWASFGLLPHIDYFDDPDRRPGCGFVGGRISSIAPLLAPGAIPATVSIDVQLRPLPANGDEILRDLRSRAGLWSAPGALFARSAWTDASVAVWLDRLRANGDEAQLIIAHAQGALALRKAWLAVEWGVGVRAGSALALDSGAAAVGRALIDLVALIDRLAAPTRVGHARPAHREQALAALLTALNHCVRHVRAADASDDAATVSRRLTRALDWARTIVDATGVFSVAADSEDRRCWERLTAILNLGEIHDHAGGATAKLDRLSRELERLDCTQLGTRLERACWRPHIRRSLLRLAWPDRQARLALLSRIRCDLIFTLAATRRLDRLYRLFPWLTAIHGAFPGCAGGALGALASLYESARGVEIAKDMARRLTDGGQRSGTVARMTVRNVRAVYANPRHVVLAAGRNYAAGAALASQVTSHVMVKAALNGQTFGGGFSLEALRGGNLGYNDATALKINRTRDAVITIQPAQPTFRVTSRDDDLVRHMGLTLLRHLGAIVHSIWPTSYQRDDFCIHRALIYTARRPKNDRYDRAKDIGPWANASKYQIQYEIVRSMLQTVDNGAADDVLRDGFEDLMAQPHLDGRETSRAGKLREAPSRKKGEWHDQSAGQAAARRAGDEPTVSDERCVFFRELVDDVRRWRDRDRKKDLPSPQDDLLEDILLGRVDLAQLAPVSDLFIPILWFAPLIDRDRLAWIARGMPGQEPGGNDDPLAARLKSWLAGVRGWSWAPFAAPIIRGRDDVIACHLFTGVSSVTADWGHVK